MKDAHCTALLRWALPRLGMRWAGFRRVRGQVCKRLRRRMAELGLPDLADYWALLVCGSQGQTHTIQRTSAVGESPVTEPSRLTLLGTRGSFVVTG